MPLIVNGASKGEADVSVTMSGDGAVDAKAFYAAVGPMIIPAEQKRLTAAIAGKPKLEFTELRALGWAARFDVNALAVAIVPPFDKTRIATVSLKAYEPFSEEPVYGEPLKSARVAAMLDLAVSKSLTRTELGDDPRPATASLSGAVNVLGVRGLTVPIDAAWRERSARDPDGNALTLQPLRVLHDMPNRPMRVSAGTLTPLSAPGLNAPQLRGLSIESAYDVMQPLRDLTPSGTYMLSIQTRSIVELEVDGVIESTLELPPGRYNLRDLTSKAGMSAIKIYVTDRTGRRQVTAFPVYRSELLRERAIREFGLAVGAPVESDTSSIGIAGFYRANVSPRILLDAGLSSYRGNLAVQGEATTPLTSGVARARLGVSRFGNDLGVNASVSASKTLGPIGLRREIDRRLWSGPKTVSGIVGVSTGRFSGDPFAYASQESNYFYAATTISRGWDSAAWQASATGSVPTRGPASLGLTLGGARRFGVVGIGLQTSVKFEGGKTATTVAYTLSVSRRSEFRFHQVSITPEEIRGQWAGPPLRSGFGVLGSSASAYAVRGGYGIAASATAVTNRFNATTDQILTDGDGGRRTETRATLATGIAFADGALAVGRPLGNGAFAIVRRAPSMKGAKVSIGQDDPTKKSLRPHTGWFGPTVVGLQPYIDQSLDIDVSGAAEGYALGDLNTYMRPGYGSGYKIRVGADNWRSAIGTLVTANGPVASVRLTITPLAGDKTAQPTSGFTNPTGRFYVENLAEGEYAIEIASERVATFTIPKGAGAVTDLGTVTAKLQ